MFSDQIEKLKHEYTDQFVQVDARRPELARFRDVVGQVKTVNMNGRALVEFADYHLNTGWFDIDLSCLKVVDRPVPKAPPADAKKGGAQPAARKAPASSGDKKLSPLEMARLQGAAKGGAAPAKGGEKKESASPKRSTADILAAARGGTSEVAPQAKAAAKATPKPDVQTSSATAAKQGGGKLSTADILAAARGQASADAAPPAAPQPTEPASAPASAPAPASAHAEQAGAETTGGVTKVDKSSMSVSEMIAYCRAKDAS